MTDLEDKQVASNETIEDVMNNVREVSVGDIVKGEVLATENKQAAVGIEEASVEGVVPAKGLPTLPVEDVHKLVKTGDVLDLVVIASISKDKGSGGYLLSKRRLDAKKVWEEVEQGFQTGKVIEAPVTNVVRGDLVVDVGVRRFVPASMAEDHFVADFSEYKGQALAFKIIEIESSGNCLILSHKVVIGVEKESKKEELLSSLHDKNVVEGKVVRLTDFGAFTDLGGVDGLVHASEIAHQHAGKPNDVSIVGEDVQVKILPINPEEGRIPSSIKEALSGPWTDIETKTTVGTVLDGIIKRLTSFGAFVEVFPGVEGSVHISQVSHKHIVTPHEVLHGGD